jgi:hypothetical protein
MNLPFGQAPTKLQRSKGYFSIPFDGGDAQKTLDKNR